MKIAFVTILLCLFSSGPAFGAASFEKNLVAAEGGSALAQVKLGNSYQYGQGVVRDYQKAFFWYQKAAEQGYAKGQRPLGVLYEMGLGVDQDYEKAAYWYTKAAEQGLARAQVNLGILYEAGQGVKQDYDRAFYWYETAAKQGYGRGMNHLAMLYEKGLGRPKDVKKALSWYEKSAGGNYPKAMANLGRIYENGAKGVAIDLVKALFWLEKAAAAGYDRVLPAIKRLQKKLLAFKKVEEKEAQKREIVSQIVDKSKTEKAAGLKSAPDLGLDQEHEIKEKAQITELEAISENRDGSQEVIVTTKHADEPGGSVAEKTEVVAKSVAEEPEIVVPARVVDRSKTVVAKDDGRTELPPPQAGRLLSNRQITALMVVANIIVTWFFWAIFARKRHKRRGKSSIGTVYKLENEIKEIRRQVEKLQNQT